MRDGRAGQGGGAEVRHAPRELDPVDDLGARVARVAGRRIAVAGDLARAASMKSVPVMRGIAWSVMTRSTDCFARISSASTPDDASITV